jgi:hypothetical protein
VLKQSYESQTEIPAGLQEHYAEKDGKWLVQTDPPVDLALEVKNALNQERNLRREAEKQLVDMKTRYEGVDPDEHHRLQERVKGLDDADVYDKQGIEALVARRTESMKSEHERVSRQKDVEIGKLREALTTTEAKRKNERIKTELLNAVTASGVHADALDDAVSRGLSVFNEVDDQGNVIAKQGDDLRYGKDGVNPLSPSEWITTLKAEGRARHLWPSSSGGGAPAHHSGNGAGIDWNSITNPAERLTRFREWQATQTR